MEFEIGMVSIFNVCEIERGLISHVVLEISSFMNFLECDPCIPRPETDQGIEQAIREIKRKVGLPLDDPKSATTIHASNQSADKTLHTTTFTGKSPKSSYPLASKDFHENRDAGERTARLVMYTASHNAQGK
jgi:hypothetical protein